MHELSLAENILQQIEDAAQTQQFHRVKTVWLEIGKLACVEQEALRFFFAVVTEDSIARQAKLEIIGIAGQAVCNDCHRTLLITALYQACPYCGSYALQITQGNEMRIRELEVE
jgi:hydrogenase nickel incorporation protein HypA/HybF